MLTMAHHAALSRLVEATRRVAHDKSAWKAASTVAQRQAALECERLTKRAEKAEKELVEEENKVTALKVRALRTAVTCLALSVAGGWAQDALEKEKLRASKQQQLSLAAIQAANKRANTFEALYEAAKSDASCERHKVEAYRVAASELNRQLEFNGPDGSFPISLLQTSEVRSSLGATISPKAKTTAHAKLPLPAGPKAPAPPKPPASAFAKKAAAPKATAAAAKKPVAKATKAPAQPPATPLPAAPPSPRSSVESVKA